MKRYPAAALLCAGLLGNALLLAQSANAQGSGPYVDTPGGRMAGAALFVWNGTTWVAAGSAAGGIATKPATFTPLGCPAWQAVTTGAAVALSAVAGGIPAGATLVDIVPSVTIVMRDDGSAPTTAGPGIPIQTNTIYPYSGTLSTVQFIAQSGSGTISVCFYR